MKIIYLFYVSDWRLSRLIEFDLFLGPVNRDNASNAGAMDVDPNSSNRNSSQINNLTQLILSLDMEQWENLVEVFHIDKCMIEPENAQIF